MASKAGSEPIEEIKFMLRAHWNKAWERTTTMNVCTRRIEELHPSSFPFCGLRYAVDLATSGDAKYFEMPATMEYYVSVGTVAHLVFQKHMRLLKGNGKLNPIMIGDWKCPDCGHENLFRPYHTCRKCESPAITGEVANLSGDEISVQLGSRTTGHTDDLIKIDGRYWVIDYKTSSVRVVDTFKRFGKGLPYKHNVNQIESYSALLEKKYADRGIKIAGWFLVYAARDKPMEHVAIVGAEISEERRDYLAKMLVTSDKMFDTARKHIAPAINNCKPMFKGDREKVVKLTDTLWKNRLCPSQEFYDKEIRDPYNPCQYAEMGLCFNNTMKQYAKNVFFRTGKRRTEDEDQE